MKRILLAFLLVAIPLCSTASAVQIKASGQFIIESIWWNNPDFSDSGDQQKFNVWQRLRTQFEFIANENLRAVLGTEVGDAKWGQNGLFGLGNSAPAIDLRRMWLEYDWPDTDVNIQAGFMSMLMPNAIAGGAAVLNEEVATLALTAPANDVLTLKAGYLRPSQHVTDALSQVDGFFLSAPLEYDGWNVEPYALFIEAGKGTGNAALSTSVNRLEGLFAPGDTGAGDFTAWWGGAAMTVDAFDPFVFKADMVYGAKDSSVDRRNDMSGWFLDAGVEYTGWSLGTVGLAAIWNSGEDDDLSNGSERMPQLASDFGFGTFFYDGTNLLEGTLQSTGAQLGFWGAMLTFRDMQFLERHDMVANIIYIQGTNDGNLAGATQNWQYGRTLTTEDNLWEFDFNTDYTIYDGLTARLELSYIVGDWDESVWGRTDDQNAGKVDLGIIYEF